MLSTVIATAFMLAASLGPVPAPAHSATSARFTPAAFSTTRKTFSSPGTSAGVLTGEESEFIARINSERTTRGLRALRPDLQLVQVARAHSYDMCVRDYFSHYAPAIPMRSPMDRYLYDLHTEGLPVPNSLTVGENIYYCSAAQGTDDVACADQALINSPEHRANILNPQFDRIGVGVWRDAKGQFWVTENFLQDTD